MNDDDLPILNVLREKLTEGIASHPGRGPAGPGGHKRGPRHRPPALVLVGAALAILVVAGVVALAQPGRDSRQVAVHGPLAGVAPVPSGGSAVAGTAPGGAGGTDPALPGGTIASPPAQPGSPTTGTGTPGRSPSTGVIVNPTPPIATSPPAVTGPTTTVTVKTPPPPPATGTVVLTVTDGGRTVSVARGATIQVQLDANGSSIWPHQPTSSNGGVVEPVTGSSTPTSSHATFDALAPGTATLSTYGVPPCAVQPPPTGAPMACPALAAVWSVTVVVS